MSLQQIAPDVYAVPMGVVNAFLITAEDEVTLIDTGAPAGAIKILRSIQALGRQPADVRHILATHCHGDHTGSLAALKRATGAPVSMHPIDARAVRLGQSMRPMKPGPGLFNRLLFWLFIRPAPITVEPAEIEHEVEDGVEIPAAGGMQAIHAPGHCAGQLAFLWPRNGGVLFVADAAVHFVTLSLSPGYEDLAEGRRTLSRLAGLPFETACFGHGRAITGGAAEQFRKKWGV